MGCSDCESLGLGVTREHDGRYRCELSGTKWFTCRYVAALLSKRMLLIATLIVGAGAFWLLRPASTRLLSFVWWRISTGHSVDTQFVRVNDASLYVESVGEGPAVLLLPGGLSTIDSFFSQLPDLAARFRVIAIEPRGHGRSKPITDLTYRLLAADAVAVLDALNVPNASVVGWSDGGTTGLMMALEHPERVSRLVAISANFAPSGIDDEAQRRLHEATPDDGWFMRALYRWRAGSSADWSKLWHAVTTMWRTRPVVDISELRRIYTPTLLIVGDNDTVTTEHATEMVNELPNAELIIIEEGHHTSLIWQADQVNEQIIDFLNAAEP